ncbi:MAG TPA: adenylate/guanylate cyclase domain-containing protein [Crenotrichaceae bacterium]|nr:adenylate/guanylate cyclase domain-containing protein [Crenotrichaceae bacterium]
MVLLKKPIRRYRQSIHSLMQTVTRVPKQLFWGLLPGLIGIVLIISPFGMMVEESLGLQSLFLLRGYHNPPSEVSLLSIDAASLDALDMPYKPGSWPRSLYIEIIRQLNAQGAQLIVFTLALDQAHDPVEEQALANVLALSDNVILPRYIKQSSDELGYVLNIVVPPVALLEDAALASAVFPLPKDTERVSRFWTYKQEISEPSTLPVVVFHFWAINKEYTAFRDLVSGLDSKLAASLPVDAHELYENRNIHVFIDNMRWFFSHHPDFLKRANRLIKSSQTWSAETRRILGAWIKLYSEQSTAYLNHYGPSATVTRWPLTNLLKQRSGSPFKDSVVFVGISENLFLERNYGFHTVFSSPAARISVAEIAATAAANLMANELIEPLSVSEQITLIFIWGFMVGLIAYYLSIPRALLVTFCLSLLYVIVAVILFQRSIWIPLVIPLLMLVPFSLLCGIGCRYRRNQRVQKAIHTAFSHYIPPAMVDKLASQSRIQDFRDEGQVVHAICLSTDAGQYTRLGEMIEPTQLAKLMNDYYEIMFDPVQRYQGFISDVVGDAMLALWTGTEADSSLSTNACQAALAIHTAVDNFNKHQQYPLPTRFGMHAGQIRLGNIGSASRFEYRPVGDCVNTSNRIERLNKLLATHLLISADVVPDEKVCITRHIGSFLLEGKSNPLSIYELVGITGQVTTSQIETNLLFDQALEAYTKGDLENALLLFDSVLQRSPEDGPSRFYYQRCGFCLSDQQKQESWTPVITM